MSVTGRLLGVDFGKVRIGLAVCDPGRIIASPLETYHRQSEEVDRSYFRRLIREEDIAGLVIGLPIHLNGREGELAQAARQFGTWLAETTRCPVTFWDERFTSSEAQQFMQMAGLSRKKKKNRIDRVAAQILLQSYLDAGCPPNPKIGSLDEGWSSGD